jgi:hypothetical protein
MAHEEPAQVALPHAHLLGKCLHIAAIQRAVLDEAQGPGHGCRGSAPGGRSRRGLWPAAQAGAVARLLGGGRAGDELTVLPTWGRGRADRTAVDASALHRGEEAAVETRIPRAERAVADFRIGQHGRGIARFP